MKKELPNRENNFSAWYNQVVSRAGLAEHGPVKGTMVIKPYGFQLWDNIKDVFVVENNGDILIQSNQISQKFDKPWGYYEILSKTPGQQIKKLTIFSGESTSLQTHQFRSEHWIITHGIAKVTVENEMFNLNQNDSIYIPKGSKHRIENFNHENLCLLEIQTGVYLEEDDITRFEDKYARTNSSK